MGNRVDKYLFDILESVNAVDSYVSQVASFDEFTAFEMLRRAVEREIEIIGEAMNRVLKIQPEIKIRNTRRIVDTRNKIIHGYDEVDDVVIYVIATKYLRELKKEINQVSR